MAMDLKEIEKYIKEAMPDAIIEIQDLAGDGNHYSATVISSQFAKYITRAIKYKTLNLSKTKSCKN